MSRRQKWEKIVVGDIVRLLCNDQEVEVVEVIDHRRLRVQFDGTHASWASRGHTGNTLKEVSRRRVVKVDIDGW